MTLDDVISEALVLLDEPSDGSFWTTSEKTLLARRASRLVWYRLSAVDPKLLSKTTAITYPADTESYDLSTALTTAEGASTKPLRLLSVATLPNAAAVTNANKPVELEEINTVSAAAYSGTHPGSYVKSPYWCYERGNLKLVPPPTTSKPLYVQYVPFPQDVTKVLDDVVPEYEDLVIEVLVTLMSAKEREPNQALMLTQQKIDEYIRSFTGAKTRTKKLITGIVY